MAKAIVQAPHDVWDRKSGWDSWDIRQALSTLSNANKIRKNKPLMSAVRAEAKRQLEAAKATHATIQGDKA